MRMIERSRKMLLAAVALLLLGAGVGFAGDAPLERHEVERWLASMEELHSTSAAQEPLATLARSMNDASNFGELADAVVRTSPAMEEVLRRHDFASGGEWALTWSRTWVAFLYMMMSEEIPAARARLEAQRRDIEADPDLSEETREMMFEELDFAERRLVIPFEAPATDVAIVRQYREELETQFRRLQRR